MTRLSAACAVLALALPSPAALLTPAKWTALGGTGMATDARVMRDGKASTRIEPSSTFGQGTVRSANVKLTVGKYYEVSGWLRTEAVSVEDPQRTAVATGASLSMASMPWDVHSESLGGSREWTRLKLRFQASRSEDAIEVRVGAGGGFRGKAWVEGVSLDEVAAGDPWPTKLAVKKMGPAYRFPKAGWIQLHIEGKPHERGFQHGYLMAEEIPGYMDRAAALINSKDRGHGWQMARTVADAVFLRGFDEEMLAEMRGIADGAAAAGAKYQGRKIDLVDIVAANTITEIDLLSPAARVTPTGLEGLGLMPPAYFDANKPVGPAERCSAFAATGKATRDGRMVIAHTTFWPLTLAEQTNVMLDVKPERGHRVMMQSYPGGIQSGTDWYQNDVGVVLTETTIRQSPFDIQGTPVAYRARKAIQYGDNIDAVVKHLSERNNGLYTNEWLIGDAQNDEIAMFELGTHRTKLWRSSKGEWYGGTEGFYWGCNNSKDLQIRLELENDPKRRPQHIPFVAGSRDLKWQEFYARYKGAIDEQFAFTAFRTAPLVSSSAFDAKVTSGEMAPKMMLWAVLGKPNEREWVAQGYNKEQFSGNEGIHSSGYALFEARATAPEAAEPAQASAKKDAAEGLKKVAEEQLWKGYILPEAEADEWLSLGSAYYHRVLSSEKPEEELKAWALRAGEGAFERKIADAVMRFDAIRRQMGDEKFLSMMREFFERNTTKTVRTADFPVAVPAVDALRSGVLLSALFGRAGDVVIVYGTEREAGSNRHAAELLQASMNNWFEQRVPIVKDFELTPEQAAGRSLVLFGRPETNSALRAMVEKLGLRFDGASFEAGGKTYAHERDGLAWAGVNPANAGQMVVVLAGNSAVETVRLAGVRIDAKVWQVTRKGEIKASGL